MPYPCDATQAPIRPRSDPIRFQRIQRSGGAIERTIERIVVAVIPEPLAVVGRYVRVELMDCGVVLSNVHSVKAYVGE